MLVAAPVRISPWLYADEPANMTRGLVIDGQERVYAGDRIILLSGGGPLGGVIRAIQEDRIIVNRHSAHSSSVNLLNSRLLERQPPVRPLRAKEFEALWNMVFGLDWQDLGNERMRWYNEPGYWIPPEAVRPIVATFLRGSRLNDIGVINFFELLWVQKDATLVPLLEYLDLEIFDWIGGKKDSSGFGRDFSFLELKEFLPDREGCQFSLRKLYSVPELNVK